MLLSEYARREERMVDARVVMDRFGFNFRLVVVLVGALGGANERFLTVAGLKTRTICAFAE
jgi:hypothetical protein